MNYIQNPYTGRFIKFNGTTYKSLFKQQYGGMIDKNRLFEFFECDKKIKKSDYNKLYKDKDNYFKLCGKECYFYDLLKSSGLTPKIIEKFPCGNDYLIHIETYDNTLDDYLETNNKMDAKKALEEIARLSLILNIYYGIRHGDFHTNNILYKKYEKVHIDWGLIDFENSRHTDINTNKILMDNFSYKRTNYNPYFDLIYLMFKDYREKNNYFFKNIPEEYFNSAIDELIEFNYPEDEIEEFIENIQDLQNDKNTIFIDVKSIYNTIKN